MTAGRGQRQRQKFIRIVDWERFQHYKDRNPPWIKLHQELLTSQTWVTGTDANRVLAIACMLIAAKTGNRIPLDHSFLQRVAYLNQEPDLSGLISTQFIEIIDECGSALVDASKLHTNARPETETETEKKDLSSKLQNSFDEALLEAWTYYLETLKKNPKLYIFSAVRKNKGLARLRECYALATEPKLENAVNLMKLCIDRLAESSFHNGDNRNGKKFLDWELLFRSREKLTYWLDGDNFSNGSTQGRSKGNGQASLDAGLGR